MRALKPFLAAAAALLLVVALVLGVLACGSAEQQPSGATTGSQPGVAQAASDKDAAPPFSGVTLAGKTVSLEQYRGKPLLLVYMTHT